MKFGFDHAHAPVENGSTRFDDVELTYSSATGRRRSSTLFGTPFILEAAVDVTALYVQDSYSIKRLTLTGGLRWERLEGYLPGAEQPAVGVLSRPGRGHSPSSATWSTVHTVGPRLSAAYDLIGNGADRRQVGAGRYYYIIPGRRRRSTPSTRTATTREQFTWNDANGDLVFQPGEQTGTPVIPRQLRTVSIDPDYRRPYTDEYTAGVDHELMPASVRLSVVYTYRREKYPQATVQPGQPVRHDPDHAAGHGPRRRGRHRRRWHVPVLQPELGGQVNLIVPHQRSDQPADLQRDRVHADQADARTAGRCWRATRTRRRASSGVSVNINPNLLINNRGPLAGQNRGGHVSSAPSWPIGRTSSS